MRKIFIFYEGEISNFRNIIDLKYLDDFLEFSKHNNANRLLWPVYKCIHVENKRTKIEKRTKIGRC